jgi:hypothetical protein
MERHARDVGKGDASARCTKPLATQVLEQALIEAAANTLAPLSLVDVDGDIGRPAIGGALPVSTGVRVAEQLPATFGNKPRMSDRDSGDSIGYFSLIGGGLLE